RSYSWTMRTPASKKSALASATIAKLYMISLMSFWTAYRFRSGPPGVFFERHQRWTEYGDWSAASLGAALQTDRERQAVRLVHHFLEPMVNTQSNARGTTR